MEDGNDVNKNSLTKDRKKLNRDWEVKAIAR
jgi:hypothetical protein